MKIEDIAQPTEPVTQNCPSCGTSITAIPYDIGSGAELSCANCEQCWGADGQPLVPVETPILVSFKECGECGKAVGVPWPAGEAPTSCAEHSSPNGP